MDSGRTLDAAIWEKVFGRTLEHYYGDWPFGPSGQKIPKYSTEIAAAWPLVERFGFMIHPTGNGPKGKPAGYWVGFLRDGQEGLVGDMENQTVVFAEEAAHAICLAALQAVGALVKS